MLSKSLIPFSVDGWGCVPSLLFDLRPNYGGSNEDMKASFKRSHAWKNCCTQCPQPCSRPPPSHTSARDSWILTGKSGSVSCGGTAPFSWVLVQTRFCLCPPRHASWEICMQIKKQLLELDMEQQTASKLGKKYIRAVYCHPAHLTYTQSTSWEILDWMKHKLESRLLGPFEGSLHIFITSTIVWPQVK